MRILLASIYKELLVLVRDISALSILFLMPLALVIIMALIQDGPYQSFQKTQTSIVIVNEDNHIVGHHILSMFESSGLFIIHDSIDGAPANAISAQKAVSKGQFKAGIIIPDNISNYLNKNVILIVGKSLSMQIIDESNLYPDPAPDSLRIKVFYDPMTLKSVKSIVSSTMEKTIAEIVSQAIVERYYKRLEHYHVINNKIQFDKCNIVEVDEIIPDNYYQQIILNSVQHNVPGWSLFAVFFVFLPLAGAIIKERDDGTFLRLRIMPGSFLTLIIGKIILYIIVGILQFLLLLAVGLYLLPLMELNSLIIGNNFLAIAAVMFTASIAGTAFGVLIGTFSSTHQQAITFGSISVIILAALGGIWVPAYIMSDTMINISKFSPLQWGMNALNELFIYNGGFSDIYLDIFKLMSFSFFSFLISFIFLNRT